MDLSIIYVNYKSENLIYNSIKSIIEFHNSITIEFIVMDNLFQENANREILSHFPQVIWENMGFNAGFSKANNRGLSIAKGKYVLFLNADTQAIDHSIENALAHLKNDSNIIAVGGLQIDEQLNPIPFYRTQNELRKDLFILPNNAFFKKLIWNLLPKEKFEDPNETNNIVGFFMLMEREKAVDNHGWDEQFFLYGEDVEFSYRLHQKGKICYFDDVRMVHLIQENPYRRKNISFVNRFSVQVQLSNLLWIRKSYGLPAYLILMINYGLLVPLFWVWKTMINLSKGHHMSENMDNQIIFSKKVAILFTYFFDILFLKDRIYQIKPEENIP